MFLGSGWLEQVGVVVIDRIRTGHGGSTELLGGAQMAAHVCGVCGGGEPPERVMAVRYAPVH